MVPPDPGHGVLADPQPAGQRSGCPVRQLVVGVVRVTLEEALGHVPSGSHDRRPRLAAIRPTPSTPRSAKRRRRARTESPVVPHRRATSLVATPSATSSSARACITIRCGSDVERAILSSDNPLVVGHRQRRSSDRCHTHHDTPELFHRQHTRSLSLVTEPGP